MGEEKPETILVLLQPLTLLCGCTVDCQPDRPGANKHFLRTCNLRSRGDCIPFYR